MVEGVSGRVVIRDGAGRTDTRFLSGNVVVAADGSGDLSITDVDGAIRTEYGSGAVTVSRATRKVTVTEDSSGSIRKRRVDGNRTVQRDRSGSVFYEGIAGRVSLPEWTCGTNSITFVHATDQGCLAPPQVESPPARMRRRCCCPLDYPCPSTGNALTIYL